MKCVIDSSLCQLDGFDSRGDVKVLLATNRPVVSNILPFLWPCKYLVCANYRIETLDPALLRPGKL